MYAVIKAGGHQYRVQEGDTITIDRIEGDAGKKVTFNEVLLLGKESQTTIGTPHVPNTMVDATIKEQTKNDKIIVFKYKRRKNYKRTGSQKQPVTVVEIQKIHA